MQQASGLQGTIRNPSEAQMKCKTHSPHLRSYLLRFGMTGPKPTHSPQSHLQKRFGTRGGCKESHHPVLRWAGFLWSPSPRRGAAPAVPTCSALMKLVRSGVPSMRKALQYLYGLGGRGRGAKRPSRAQERPGASRKAVRRRRCGSEVSEPGVV